LAVFPGTQAAYDKPMGDVLDLIWSSAQSVRDWRCRRFAEPAMVVKHTDDPLHRFWCWTNEVLAAADWDDLPTVFFETAVYFEEFDQIAFKQCAYGNYRLIFTWLVLRDDVYRVRYDCAEVPPCPFSPQNGESVFRLLQYGWLPATDIHQLLAICRLFDGRTWAAVQRDSAILLQIFGARAQSLSDALVELQHTEPKDVRFCGRP
jgi:hypothetical protein